MRSATPDLVMPATGSPAATVMRRLAALLAASLIALVSLFWFAPPASAHDQLVGTDYELSPDGSTVTIILSFNNQVMDVGIKTVATGPDGQDLIDGDPDRTGRDVTQQIAFPGFDQTVTFSWRVTSSDGHPISDTFAFAIVERDGGTELQFRDVPEAPPTVSEEPQEDLLPTGARIALVIGAGAVAAATATAAVVASRRRKQAMEGRTNPSTEDRSADDAQPPADDEDD